MNANNIINNNLKVSLIFYLVVVISSLYSPNFPGIPTLAPNSKLFLTDS